MEYIKEKTILNNLINEFVENYGLDHSEPTSELFEKFINFCVVSGHVVDNDKNFDDMETGTAEGIDGIAILVNNRLIKNVDDLAEFAKNSVEIVFIFVQTKTTATFEKAQILNFADAVQDFLTSTTCRIPELDDFWQIKNEIYGPKSPYIKKGNPKCYLYYATTSSSADKPSIPIQTAITRIIEKLNATNYLSDKKDSVIFKLLGDKEIQRMYRKMGEAIEETINFSNKVVYPTQDENQFIEQAYSGWLPIKEYMNLLYDEEEKEIKPVFEDNIRDYLGTEKNDVNIGIKNQLLGKENELFGLLNNGVTVISENISTVGNRMTLTNYQIVNGCQTSNVIFESRDSMKNSAAVFIPIRVIETKNEKTRDEIIRATNSQTGMKSEQIDALNEFQKGLEEFYTAKRSGEKGNLFYERRTNQYRTKTVKQSNIVNITQQIKGVVVMFYDNPHGVSGHYGTVASRNRSKIFLKEHLYEPYFISGLILNRIEAYFRKSEKKYRRTRWILLLSIKIYYQRMRGLTLSSNLSNKMIHTDINQIERDFITQGKADKIITKELNNIKEFLNEIKIDIEKDRKVFERKDTTDKYKNFLYKKYIKKSKSENINMAM